jgi:hypothetical protein
MRLIVLLFSMCVMCAGAELTVSGTRFFLDGRPFPYTGISFFNAIHNQEFNRDSASRRQWLGKFRKYGIHVIRVWGQWDSKRGFVDTCAECTLYQPDGELRTAPLDRLKQICGDADAMGMVVELVLFSQESWRDGIKLSPEAADRAVASVTRELMPWRNVVLQIWNEFDEHTVDHVKTIKAADPKRLVTNSPGVAGVLIGMRGEMEALDFLTPHTSRQGSGRTWEIAPKEISYLLARYRKPVVDDEPARNGTPQFGGPKETTSPYDHILQIQAVWQAGGYVTYHHDMFQMGKGHPTVPSSGIPDPEFSPYHRQVLEFLAMRDRYLPR